MRRTCFFVRIRSGAEERYDRLHAEMGNDLVEAIRHVEAEPDLPTSMASLEARPPFREWAKRFDGVLPDTENGAARLIELEEIWHVD